MSLLSGGTGSDAANCAAGLLATSLGATHVTETNSGHFIENENPALVIEQICAVITPAGEC
jgi:hypothetical protein